MPYRAVGTIARVIRIPIDVDTIVRTRQVCATKVCHWSAKDIYIAAFAKSRCRRLCNRLRLKSIAKTVDFFYRLLRLPKSLRRYRHLKIPLQIA